MTGQPSLKLLFLLPFPPDLRGSHGGSRATAEIIDMLAKDHRVRVLYLCDADAPPPRELPNGCVDISAISIPTPRAGAQRRVRLRFIEALGELAWRAPFWARSSWSPVMADRAAKAASEFLPDVVHCEFHVMAQYIPFVRKTCPSAKYVVTEHEPGIIADEGGSGKRSIRQRIGSLARRQAWRRFERRVLPLADAIITFTAPDAAALGRLLGDDLPPVTVIPLRLPGVTAATQPSAEPVQSDFVFVGNFGHPPNADAARRLVNNIVPLILRDMPAATVTIVGANPPDDVSAAASDRIQVTGWVDDPLVYLAGAKVVLVPLRQGGGLRVKMLEACASGKAIVASRTSVEGLSLTDGKEVMLAETDEEFAAKALALIGDAKTRARLEVASREWSAAEQDEGRWSAQYGDFYSKILASARNGSSRSAE